MGRDVHVIIIIIISSSLLMLYTCGAAAADTTCNMDTITECTTIYRKCTGDVKPNECLCLRTYYRCLKKYKRSCFKDQLQYVAVTNGIKKIMLAKKCRIKGQIYEDEQGVEVTAGEKRPSHCYPRLRPAHICQLVATATGVVYVTAYKRPPSEIDRRGTWPMIDNNLFTVQITVRAKPTPFISQVTVIIDKYQDCAGSKYLTYTAFNSELPSIFKAGTSTEGFGTSIHSDEAKTYSLIRLSHANTSIVIRRHSSSSSTLIGYSVTILSPPTAGDRPSICGGGGGAQAPCSEATPPSEHTYTNLADAQYQPDIELLMPEYTTAALEGATARCSSSAPFYPTHRRHLYTVISVVILAVLVTVVTD